MKPFPSYTVASDTLRAPSALLSGPVESLAEVEAKHTKTDKHKKKSQKSCKDGKDQDIKHDKGQEQAKSPPSARSTGKQKSSKPLVSVRVTFQNRTRQTTLGRERTPNALVGYQWPCLLMTGSARSWNT